MIGRSRGFWTRFLPDLRAEFPEIGLDVDGMVRAMNKVEPELVRVGADELTYNLHILVRFELEVEIVTGRLAIRDLPEAWNAKYADYLGLTPPTDALGCLQDVHWSRGSVGYFPTYTFGNLIGLQVFRNGSTRRASGSSRASWSRGSPDRRCVPTPGSATPGRSTARSTGYRRRREHGTGRRDTDHRLGKVEEVDRGACR